MPVWVANFWRLRGSLKEGDLSEEEKIDLLLRAFKRGLPLERVYRMLILRNAAKDEISQEDRFRGQQEDTPSEYHRPYRGCTSGQQ